NGGHPRLVAYLERLAKDARGAPLGEVGYFRREDLETFVSFTERAAYCLETAFRGPLVLASKPLGSLLDFLSESCGLTHDGLLVSELASDCFNQLQTIFITSKLTSSPHSGEL